MNLGFRIPRGQLTCRFSAPWDRWNKPSEAAGIAMRRSSSSTLSRMQLAAILLMSGLGPAMAGQATGTINVVNISPAWGGAFVQLDIPPAQVYETQCPNANWTFIPISSNFYASILATLLSAKTSGDTVTVYTDGCITLTMGSQPLIWAVDLGQRMSGT